MLALVAAAHPEAAQDAAGDLASHPVVGLWQGNGGWNPVPGAPDWGFAINHPDRTFINWRGLNVGTALGIWRPTGERTAEAVSIWKDTDPSPGPHRGWARRRSASPSRSSRPPARTS
jgi:hypothetical protein